MKKSRKQKRPAKKNQPVAQPSSKPKRKMSRRELMGNALTYGVGAVVLGGVGYWGISSVTGSMAEQDLSIVGSGTPVIVQVHDPACQTCTDLQREARAALREFDDADLGYRVAYITNEDGLAFATEHGASYATLLFFDADGQETRRIRGATNRNTLRAAFLSHVAAN